MKKIKYMLIWACLLCFNTSLSIASEYESKPRNGMTSNIAATQLSDQLLSLKIMLGKLRTLMFNLKDLNELEEIGLSYDDVHIMRSTLLAKIHQTKLYTLALIRSL
ncbi:MAG: hypothetical protein Q9N67_04325 [Ghiorsea sp.]|nr:hypothetical protein [Ghiorsea sp.]